MATWVYAFDAIDEAEAAAGDWDRTRGLLGGKGANLGDMARLGVPVPPGFTITTEACNAYQAAGELPEGLWDQVLAALGRLEEQTGKRFGDPAAPLLVSCRSGAKFSMPGMMDTVLDIGLNDAVVEGLIAGTGDARFAWDSYRRLLQMFGSVVLGVRDEPFEDVLTAHRRRRDVTSDAGLDADDLRQVVDEFRAIVGKRTRTGFPDDPYQQLELAVRAVFESWNGRRARDYREAAGIAHDLGTAVNVVTMVYGNMRGGSATGVAVTRNVSTGEPELEGDYLLDAQGEDVVAGIRATSPIERLAEEMPEVHRELSEIAARLERHYRDVQDIEFTVEQGKLWILQTRNAKRTARAAVRIAVDLVDEGLISAEEALERVTPAHVEAFLHPRFATDATAGATAVARGLAVSPGAATGVVAFDADRAERWARDDGRAVVLVRPETKPDDVHGMLAAVGVLTSSGGRTSHAALVARQFGRPAVVGASTIEVDPAARRMTVGDLEIAEGEWISIDGGTGDVYVGRLDTEVPEVDDPHLARLLGWADERRRLGVRANADEPEDAERALRYGAEGIGLCRTEHMFFAPDRLPIVRRMILASGDDERREAITALLPLQREDFLGLFRVMGDRPVVIRLIDPPLHEFLPSYDEVLREITDREIRLGHARDLDELEGLLDEIGERRQVLDRVAMLREANPMLGTRGVRLGIMIPELTRMQVRAVFEAACRIAADGGRPEPEVMIPLTAHERELALQRAVLEEEARAVMGEQGVEVAYRFGTMIEVPRAALTAGAMVEHAEFLSFGTNDLTQATYAMSRDDAEAGFLVHYLEQGVLPANPFATLDEDGVGRLMGITVAEARAARPDVVIGVCGEHGGEPASIALCHRLGLDYVSCSPYRVPVARLAAAHAALGV